MCARVANIPTPPLVGTARTQSSLRKLRKLVCGARLCPPLRFSPQRARLRCALGAPRRGPLLPAFHAFARPRRNDIAIIVLPVIVGDLISGTNGLDCTQDDLAL